METFNVYVLLVVVVILGTKGENIAIGKPTQQSSLFAGGVSSRAVDGNTDSNYNEGNSCTHTDSGQTEWWCVDLQAVYNNISYILLYNRATNKERLQGFTLKTSSNGECNEEGFTSATTCYINTPSSVEDIYRVDTCNQPSSSLSDTRFIFITVDNNKPLTLCEVQVIVCPTNCKDGKCKNNGECIDGCKSGYFGNKCNTPCNNNCNNVGCDQTTGRCNGCIVGKYGDQCDITCNENCNDGGCETITGKCNNGCKEGRYGDQCNIPCSTNCNNGCDRSNGKCNSCKVGWYGDQCDMICYVNCNNECNRSNGRCNNCKVGWYGDQCDILCNNCKNGCDQQNAKCIGGCNGKFYGDKCEMECTTCQTSCQQSYGVCNNGGCVDGYWGAKCLTSCSSNCVSRQCGQGDGRCTNGCTVGHYGEHCNETCSNGCIDKDCDRDGGRCTCTVAGINKKMTEDSSISPAVYIIIGFIVGVVVTVIVGVLIYIFYIKRRMIKKPSTGTESVIYNNRSDTDGNINTTYNTLDQVSHDDRDTTYTSLDNRENQHGYYNQEPSGENPLENKDNQYYNITKQ